MELKLQIRMGEGYSKSQVSWSLAPWHAPFDALTDPVFTLP